MLHPRPNSLVSFFENFERVLSLPPVGLFLGPQLHPDHILGQPLDPQLLLSPAGRIPLFLGPRVLPPEVETWGPANLSRAPSWVGAWAKSWVVGDRRYGSGRPRRELLHLPVIYFKEAFHHIRRLWGVVRMISRAHVYIIPLLSRTLALT